MHNILKTNALHPLLIGAIAALLPPSAAFALDSPGDLITDRPDQTESTAVIVPGYVQIEAGASYIDDRQDGRSVGVPGTLIRAGIVERLELRIGFGGWIRGFEEPEDSGLADTELGFKVYLWEERGLRPEAALLAHVSLPTGEEGYSAERPDPSFRFAFSHSISERIGIGYNLGVSWETVEEPIETRGLQRFVEGRAEGFVEDAIDNALTGIAPEFFRGRLADEANARLFPERFDRDTQATLNYTATTGIGVSDKLGMFIEVFGDVPLNAPGGTRHYADGGLTYRVRENIQLDLSGGVGLNTAADGWFVGAGISVRFAR